MDVVNQIIEFIKTYYQFIALGLSILIFVLDVVILGVRNRQPLMTIISNLRERLPSVVIAAEASGLKGEEKLAFAVDLAQDYLRRIFPKIDVNKYTKTIVKLVEEILTTPQKKGV